MGSAGQDWEEECGVKEGSFQNSVDVFIMSLLPGISQTRTFLNVYGAELRVFLKKNKTDHHHHHLWQPRALALNTPFSLAPPFPPRPLPSCFEDLSPSLSLSRMPQKVTCRLWRYSEAGVLVFAGGAANLRCTGRGVNQCERVPQSTP